MPPRVMLTSPPFCGSEPCENFSYNTIIMNLNIHRAKPKVEKGSKDVNTNRVIFEEDQRVTCEDEPAFLPRSPPQSYSTECQNTKLMHYAIPITTRK